MLERVDKELLDRNQEVKRVNRKWSTEDHQIFIDLYREHGNHFAKIARLMDKDPQVVLGHKKVKAVMLDLAAVDKECGVTSSDRANRERWYSKENDQIFLNLCREHGNQNSVIAGLMNKSSRQIFNHKRGRAVVLKMDAIDKERKRAIDKQTVSCDQNDCQSMPPLIATNSNSIQEFSEMTLDGLDNSSEACQAG